MADDAQSIRNINWRELFPFLNLFRAFRIAIHPSKLVLGFAMLVLLYGGGRLLDWVWPRSQYAVYHELDQYDEYRWTTEQHLPPFSELRDRQADKTAEEYKRQLVAAQIIKDDEDGLKAARAGEFRTTYQKHFVTVRNKALEDAATFKEKALKENHEAKITEKERIENQRKINDRYEKMLADAQTTMLASIASIDEVTPHPLFDTFFEYEVHQFHNVVDSALNWNFLGGITHGTTAADAAPEGRARGREPGVPSAGALRSIVNLAVTGPCWLLQNHFIYFIVYIVWFLLCWAIFGGAIARIAAVHVARDEKISVRQALRFSSSKLLSFVFAPIIPLVIILVAGIVVGAGGLLFYIPVIGPLVAAVVFFLALLAGFVMTLVAVGTIGGINLMYPTIAVEGSDSFDAISRSFSYIFARPWRMIFYTVVSLLYASLCFLFVRYFVYIMLALTHFFVQWFLWGKASHYYPEIWPSSTDTDLTYRINFQALSWSDGVAAFLIAFWVYIVLTFLASFVVSFYFSGNTIIYFLMRKEVDATELDDVYVEETEEDFGDTTTTPPAATTAATTTPAATTPPVSTPTTTPPPAGTEPPPGNTPSAPPA